MKPTITAFAHSPDRGQGLARDFRVRWALEEVGQPYAVRLVTFDEMKQAEYRALQPFGQIPVYRDGDLVLFESASIILHIAETHSGLLPGDADARARAITWIFSAQTTIEPPIVDYGAARLFESDKPWTAERLPVLEKRVRTRLDELVPCLGDKEWLEEDFTIGDLLMVEALRRLGSFPILEDYPSLAAYVARAGARPAFKRAFEAQRAVFEAANAG